MKIRLAEDEVVITQALGFGRRIVFWTQGCPMNSENCISPEKKSSVGGRLVETEVLFQWICDLMDEDVEGVTISGGEPFSQPEALLDICRKISSTRLTIMVYSGYTLAHLRMSGNSSISGENEYLSYLL